jgi:UPF0755 protein
MARRLAAIAVVIGLLAAVAAGTAAWAWRVLNEPISVPADAALFEVPSGAGLASITRELGRKGVIPGPRLLQWYGRFRGDATRIHAGEYVLTTDLTSLSLLDKLRRGEVYLHQFTIIEGWRFTDLLTQLRADPAIAAGSATPAEIMTALGEPELHPEGQFLPDTYSFPRGTTDVALLGWAHAALGKALAEAWATRAEDSVLATPYEALILASIVEKETALASERRLIAGVFHERLARGMRLQTDPTVIYGLGDAYDGNIRRRDLEADTPYNTYTRRGLPPTPISLPGVASIRAATNPERTGALYFVATGEPDGSHKFSRTLEEHNQAVRNYVRRQRAAE